MVASASARGTSDQALAALICKILYHCPASLHNSTAMQGSYLLWHARNI